MISVYQGVFGSDGQHEPLATELAPPAVNHSGEMPRCDATGCSKRRFDDSSVETWHCAAPTAAASRLLPLLIYAIGPSGPAMASGVFQLQTRDENIGDIYMVASAGGVGLRGNATGRGPGRRARPPFIGPMSERWCYPALPPKKRARVFIGGRPHYHQQFVLEKLALLDSLPEPLESVALLDSDVYLMPGFAPLLMEQLDAMVPPQFVAAPRAEARTWLNSNGGKAGTSLRCSNANCLAIPAPSEGINSGCLLLHLGRLREWNARACDGGARPWWQCVIETAGAGGSGPGRDGVDHHGYIFQGGDNGVWNTLVALQPQLFRPLPCGTHVSVNTLYGLAVRLIEREGGAPLCKANATPAVRAWYHKYNGLPWGAYDTCEHPVHGHDHRLGPVLRAPPGGVKVAVVHGAARLQPLALHVGALWASPDEKVAARRLVMRELPCWCLSFVKGDDTQPQGARPLAPRGVPTVGCIGRRPELKVL